MCLLHTGNKVELENIVEYFKNFLTYILRHIPWFCSFRYLKRKTYFPLRAIEFDCSAVLH
jgi:hypothetical protein